MYLARGTPPAAPAAWLLAVLLAASLTAQDRGWKLPLRGAAQYARSTEPLVVAPPEVDRAAGIRVVVRDGDQGGHTWRHRQFRGGLGADGWRAPDYDDGDWSRDPTPFGSAWQRTAWPADQRYLDARAEFRMGRRAPRAAVLHVGHDDRCDVSLNGVTIYRSERFLLDQWIVLDEAALEAFEPGRNVLAARVENTGGASHFDLGLTICDRNFRDPQQAVELVRNRAQEASRTRDRLFPAFRAPPFLCQGQLDDERERLAATPIDLRDLGPLVAFDLSRTERAHGVDRELPRTFRFGDVRYRGRAETTGPDGIQRIEAEVRSRVPEERGDDARFVERFVRPHHSHDFEGTLVLDRRLDVERGVVEWFRYELRGRFTARRGSLSGVEFEFGFTEEWRLTAVRENRDTWFDQAVIEAIRRGAEKLRKEIADPGRNVLRNQPDGNRTYNSGRLALALLALLHAEVSRDDPVVRRGMDELRQRRFYDTYSTAHAIMAMERYYAPRGEYEALRSGDIERPYERRPSDADRALLQEWRDRLLANVDDRVDRAYLLRFNYEPGGRYDHSVTQYGLLGLYSAFLCGIEVPPTVWQGAANHLIDAQQRPSGRHRLRLVSYAQWESAQRGGTTSTGDLPVRVAGWGYQGPQSNGVDQPIYGAMTCAGIAGLTICLAGLRDAGVTRSELVGESERAMRRGFAWLAENFTVHANARRYQQPYYWVYYYLYGLERACELSGVALLDGRDWYYEGALTLLALQRDDGGWPDDLHPDEVMERTAMAVLFLKKASMPVYTQR